MNWDLFVQSFHCRATKVGRRKNSRYSQALVPFLALPARYPRAKVCSRLPRAQDGHIANLIIATLLPTTTSNSYSLSSHILTSSQCSISLCINSSCHLYAHLISRSPDLFPTWIRSSAWRGQKQFLYEESLLTSTKDPQRPQLMGGDISIARRMAMPLLPPSAMANQRGPLVPLPKSKPDLLSSSYASLASTLLCEINQLVCLISEAI